MSGFIFRDYASPVKFMYNNKVKRKALFGKLMPRATINGVEVFTTMQFYQNSSKVRSDALFKRFLRSAGIIYKDFKEQILSTENLDKVENIYFKLSPNKLVFTPKTPAETVVALNAKYTSVLLTAPIPAPTPTQTVFKYLQGSAVNDIIVILPVNTAYSSYAFLLSNSTRSSVSEDGFFSISPTGTITMTAAGVDSAVNKATYLESDIPPSYVVSVLQANATYHTYTILLTAVRDYVDVRITVGGDMTTTPAIFNTVTSGTPDMFTDLALLRTTLEADPLMYFAGVYNREDGFLPKQTFSSSRVNFGKSKLSLQTAMVGYDEEWGHELDTVALLDDGSVFECVTQAGSEVLAITPLNAQYSGLQGTTTTTLLNISYSYTKRYKLKRAAVEEDALVANIFTVADKIPKGGAPKIKSFSIGTIGMINTTTMTTVIKDAVYNLNTDFEYEDDDIFYRGKLRVSAFDSMSALEFNEVFAMTFNTGFTKKKSKWYSKVLAVIIIIIAVVILVLSLGKSYTLSSWMFALGMTMLFLTVAGMVYAANIDDAAGMKLIAGATQITGIALSVVAIMYGYYGVQEALANYATAQAAMAGSTAAGVTTLAEMSSVMLTMSLQVGTASASLALATASFVVNTFDVGGEKERQILAVLQASYGIMQSYASLQTAVTPVQNVTGAINLANQGAAGYFAVDNLGNHTKSPTAAEQAIPEDGIEAVYIMQERSVSFDAQEALDNKLRTQFGVEATNMIVAKQSL